jgi:type I restriction enzyme S subunit
LFNRTNSPDLAGKTGVFREAGTYAYAGYLVRLRVNNRAVPEFVSAYLNSRRGKAIPGGMCKAIIGMANINAQELRSISIPIPPLDLQHAFGARVAEIDRLKTHYRAHLAKLDALFASLQHRAFRGEL